MLSSLSYRMFPVAAILLLLSVSCTGVKFSDYYVDSFDEADDLANNQKSEISFDIDWPSEVASNDVPMYVTVVMNRLQNSSVHYVFSLDRSGNYVDGFGDEGSSDGSAVPDDGVVDDGVSGISESDEGDDTAGDESDADVPADLPEEEPENPLLIHNGYYSVAAVAVSDNDDILYSDVEEFENSIEFGMRDVYLSIPKVSDDDLITEDYIDFNPVYPYIRPIGHIYYMRPSGDSHTLVTAGQSNVISIEPVKLTRTIKFSLDLKTEPGVVVTKMYGAISGVPRTVRLMTGNVTDRNTAKVPFDMVCVSGIRYEGNVNVLGLFPPEDPALVVGPGILTVIVHVTAEESETQVRRIFYANLNLLEQIQDADIMRRTEDMTGYVFTDKPSYHITLDKTLELTKDMVMSGVTEGYEDWMPNDNSPDDHPGLNPEL